MSFEFQICKRFLLQQKNKGYLSFLTFISLLGVTIGVGALLVILSVMNGFTTHLENNLIESHSHILIQKKDHTPFKSDNEIVEKIKSFRQVLGISPFMSQEMIISTETGNIGTQLKAIDPKNIDQVSRFSRHLESLSRFVEKKPTLEDLSKNPQSIILGSELARRLKLLEKERIKIISPYSTMGPLGSIPKTKEFEVLGVLKTGIFEIDSQYSYILLNEGQKFLDDINTISGFEVKLKNPYDADLISNKIEKDLGIEFEALDWKKRHESLFWAFKLEKIAMFVVLCFVIMIASFSIIATLFMMITDKQKQISILQALGAAPSSITKIFTYQSLFISSVGTVLGLASGTIICLIIKHTDYLRMPDIYYDQRVPVIMKSFYFISIAIVSLVISFFISRLVAKRASQITPLDGIRYVKR